jgi:hypothetical protein
MNPDSPAFAQLPPKLKLLALHNVHTLSPAAIGMLPKTITQLSTWMSPSKGVFEALPNVPLALKHLILPSICHLTAEKAKMLPLGLKNLTLPSHPILHDVLVALPKGLVSLNAPSAEISDETCAFLPPTLNQLWNDKSSLITDLGISRLPLSITSLSLGGTEKGFSITVIARFKGLKTLELKGTCHWTDYSLKELPRTLEGLRITASLLTDAGIPNLPRGLDSLRIRLNRNFTPAMIPFLPPVLVFIQLKKNVNFKMKHACLLPYGLEFHSKKLNISPTELDKYEH